MCLTGLALGLSGHVRGTGFIAVSDDRAPCLTYISGNADRADASIPNRSTEFLKADAWSIVAKLRIGGALACISEEGIRSVLEFDPLIFSSLIKVYITAAEAIEQNRFSSLVSEYVVESLPSLERSIEKAIMRILNHRRSINNRICTLQSAEHANILRSRSPYLYARIYQQTC